VFDEGALRSAIQIAILADDPVAELRKIRDAREWTALYPTFEDALRALKVDEKMIMEVMLWKR
jgi:hypothetical protein